MTTLCKDITHSVVSSRETAFSGSFTTESPSAWKAACKYYSGDNNCKPNALVRNRISKYSDIEWYLNNEPGTLGADLPKVGNDAVTKVNWKTVMSLCEDTTAHPAPTSCSDIVYADITDDYLKSSNFTNDTNTDAKGARCTEIGFYYDMKCKNDGTTVGSKCTEASDCNELEMYLDTHGHKGASIEFCRDLDGCMKNSKGISSESTGCIEFEAKDKANFTFNHLSNTGLSLTQISNKCKKVGLHLDFTKYDVKHANFVMDDSQTNPNKDSVCIENVPQFTTTTPEFKCQIIGALNAKITEINPQGQCVVATTAKDCSEVKFKLPVKYDFDATGLPNDEKNKKANVNPVYQNDASGDYGKYLCEKVQCVEGTRNAVDGMYTCKAPTAAPTPTPTAAPTGAATTSGVGSGLLGASQAIQFGIALLAVALI